jgi:MoxR-like ATPase
MDTDLQAALGRLSEIVLGKQNQLRLALSCLLARGHLLVEDIPGVGKTTVALALARVLGLTFHRVQFTSDLLPADILGVSIYDVGNGHFRFHPGPVFTQVLLADEVNRASPKTQSALLEAMAEEQVSIDGETRDLPHPFFVIATQNPSDQVGVFPLPESQLDRFLMRISMGYPGLAAERALLLERERRDLLHDLKPVLDAQRVLELQQRVQGVHTAPALIDYILALVQHTRVMPMLQHGLSPRAALALRHAAQAWAYIDGRNAVLPEDVQAVFASVAMHRLQARDRSSLPTAAEIITAVAIP